MPRIFLVALLALTLAIPGGRVAQASPTDAAEAALGGISQVGAGEEFTCARLSSGQVRCWGTNGFRELGNGLPGSSSRPVTVVNPAGDGPLTGVTQLGVGNQHTCARLGSGQARCWGYGTEGALGNGSTATSTRPVAVLAVSGAGPLTGVLQVAAGWGHSCAVVTGGQARCWGRNTEGQLGDGTNSQRLRPVVVEDTDGSGPLTGVTQITTGLYSTCARLSSGQVRCWGDNGSYQLGDGTNTTTDHNNPVVVSNSSGSGPLTGVRSVAVGYYHACARLTTGQARCWGGDSVGQLGAGGVGSQSRPIAVLNATGTGSLTGITSLATGGSTTCAVLGGGRVRCWGANAGGQIGDRTTTNRSLPRSMVSVTGAANLSGATGLDPGLDHVCVRLGSAQAVCVGSNNVGQLGDGTTEDTSRPVNVKR